MAIRRMFSLKIINTAKFLKLPIESQNLYFHLGLRADDDGIVEAFPVVKMLGSSEDSLLLLHDKEFIRIINDDLITYITNWLEHNKLRADRKTDSIYKSLLVEIMPDVKFLESKSKANDGQVTDIGQANDGQVTDKCPPRVGQDRIGQVRLGEVRLENPSVCPSVSQKIPTVTYGEEKKDNETIKKIVNISGAGYYPERTAIFIRRCITKMWKDVAIPLTLKMDMNHEEIRDCLRHIKPEHTGTAVRKLEGCNKNKVIYFSKCLLTAITESGIEETFTEEGGED